jgi:hypothetical protein
MLVCEKSVEVPDARHTCKIARFGTMVRSFCPHVKYATVNFLLHTSIPCC